MENIILCSFCFIRYVCMYMPFFMRIKFDLITKILMPCRLHMLEVSICSMVYTPEIMTIYRRLSSCQCLILTTLWRHCKFDRLHVANSPRYTTRLSVPPSKLGRVQSTTKNLQPWTLQINILYNYYYQNHHHII